MATTTDLEQTGRDANILHNYLDGAPPLLPTNEYGRLGQLIFRLIEELSSGTLLQYDGRVDSVADLPETGQLNHFYLVGPEDSQEFDEYFWVQPEGETGHWDKLGSVAIIIDDHLDTQSTNPVQNGIITSALIRVFLTSATFNKNDLMYYPTDGKLYRCNVDSTTGPFMPGSWSKVSNIADFITANYNAEVGVKNNNGGEIFNLYTHNVASGSYSHAEGAETTASNAEAHAEGFRTTASGENSHAEGGYTVAGGANSHAQNNGTIANGNAQTALGKFNVADSNSTYAVIIGCGTDDSHRANLLTVDWSGNININGLGSTVKFNNSDLILTASMVDSSLNTASVRPVQNQAVANALNNKVDTSTFNTAINSKVDALTFTSAMSSMNGAKQNKLTTTNQLAQNCIVGFGSDYIELANGERLYISSTTPTGIIPEDSNGIGF